MCLSFWHWSVAPDCLKTLMVGKGQSWQKPMMSQRGTERVFGMAADGQGWEADEVRVLEAAARQ